MKFSEILLMIFIYNGVCKISKAKYAKFIFSTIFSTSSLQIISKVNRLRFHSKQRKFV